MAGLDSNTKLLLHLNGNDGAKELVDDGNTGHIVTPVGTAQLDAAEKKFGSAALTLDGDSDYLTIPDSNDWDILANNTDDWTIDFWVKFNSFGSGGTEQNFIVHYESGSNRWLFEHVTDYGLYFFSEDSGTVLGSDLFETGEITDNNWHHVAMVIKGTGSAKLLGLYLDGYQVSYGTSSVNAGSNSGLLYVGQSGADVKYFDGNLDEIRIQKSNTFSASPNSGLTDTITVPTTEHTADSNTKLLLHCNTLDVSNSHHIPDFVGTAQLDTAEKKFGSASLALDGDSDYLTIPDSTDFDFFADNTDDWTIDFWIKFPGSPDNGSIMTQYEDSNNQWHFDYVVGSGLRIYYEVSDSAEIDIYGGEITDTNWHHVAYVKKGNKYAIYLDGVQGCYTTEDTEKTFSADLYIGARGSSPVSLFLNVDLDEIRIQKSNYFNADPVVGLTDTITVPTEEYSETVLGGSRNQAIIIIG